MKLPIPMRAAVERMRPYHPPLEGRGGKLRLDFNENTTGCSPLVRKALRKLSSADVSMYPEQETIRRELARFFRVRSDELLLTNGTDEALHLIADTFLESGDSVLLVEPTFAMYRFYSELAGARIQALRYDAKLQFPMAALLAALRARSAPRIFFLANPNNPTGNVLRAAELRRILKAAAKTLVSWMKLIAIIRELRFCRGFRDIPISWSREHSQRPLALPGCVWVASSLAVNFPPLLEKRNRLTP